jgi:hypothetical protein
MKVNENVLQVLKNFASINPNIVIESGKTIRTLSEGKNVFGQAHLDVEFPAKFGIYDLNEFLSVLGLVDEPSLVFQDSHVVVNDSTGLSKVKYFFTDTEYLTTTNKDIVIPETDVKVKFNLTNDTLNKVKRAASALGHSVVAIRSNAGSISLTILDSGNATSNTFTIDVDGTYEWDKFELILSISNLKLLPGDYQVEISSKLIAHFINKSSNVEYWIALEKSSNYGA